jgi:hypothetical protein
MKYLILLLLSVFTNIQAQNIKESKLKKHIGFLASDKLEGRGTGTQAEIKAANYIVKQFKKLGLQPRGENGNYTQVFPAKKGLPPNVSTVNARNVVGFLDNGKNETIVIGAHYDHLGKGDQGSSLQTNSLGIIHNGADDNASGVAGMLELARYLTTNDKKENFNFLFMGFSGEELGLMGSKFYLDNPSLPLEKINCMINLDMIGRYREDKGVSIGGIGTSGFWEENAASLANQMNIKFTLDSSGIGPSDHASFYLKDIPVLFLFTGAHQDYHKPSDDEHLINYQGEALLLEYVIEVINKLDKNPKIPFKKTSNPHSQSTASSFKVTLGVIPDYAFDGKGLKLDGVSDGRPAEKAGILAGDIILKIGSLEIKDVYAYMEALGKFEKGQTVKVTIKRKEEIKELDLTF